MSRAVDTAEGNRCAIRCHFVVQVFRTVILFPPVSKVAPKKSTCKNVAFIIYFIGLPHRKHGAFRLVRPTV